MRKLFLLFTVLTGFFLSGCAIGEIGPTGGSSSSSSSSSAGTVIPDSSPTNGLVLLSLNPLTNSVVTSNTTVTATLEYFITSNETTLHHFGLLQIIPMTTPGFAVITSNLTLSNRHGTVTFTLPLGNVWSLSGVQHPLSMKFSLLNFSNTMFGTELAVISNVDFSE